MILALAILAGMWVLVLVPPFLRSRGNPPKAGTSVDNFRNQLSVLERANGQDSPVRAVPFTGTALNGERSTAGPDVGLASVTNLTPMRSLDHVSLQPAPVSPARQRREAAKRRRLVVLSGLIAAVVLTFGLWVGSGGLGIFLAHAFADLLLVAFVALFIRSQRIEAEREMKVAFLPHQDAGAEPTVLLRETVNG